MDVYNRPGLITYFADERVLAFSRNSWVVVVLPILKLVGTTFSLRHRQLEVLYGITVSLMVGSLLPVCLFQAECQAPRTAALKTDSNPNVGERSPARRPSCSDAVLVATSANSFPGTRICAGTQQNVTLESRSEARLESRRWTICLSSSLLHIFCKAGREL